MKISRASIECQPSRLPEIRFARDMTLTSYAGLVVFWRLFRDLDLKARLKRGFEHLDWKSSYKAPELILLMILHILLGFCRLRGLDYYRHDPLVARIVGLARLPSVATLSRQLRVIDHRCVQWLRRFHRKLIISGLRMLSLSHLTLDFDGSVQYTGGRVEGTAVGFNKRKKGARSYYPLFATVAQTGQILDLLHRPGNVHDSKGATAFMTQTFRRARVALPNAILEARMDSAFFSFERLSALDRHGVSFTCSVPFRRLPQLKAHIEAQKDWTPLDNTYELADIDFKPKTWPQCPLFRFILVRQRVRTRTKGPIQLDLFEPIDPNFKFTVIVTNDQTSWAGECIESHHGRGSQEKLFAQAKQHAGLGVILTSKLTTNQLFTLASIAAHNLTQAIQIFTSTDRQLPANLPKRPSCWIMAELGTLRQRWLHRAGRLLSPAGRPTLEMSVPDKVRPEFQTLYKPAKFAA